MTTLNAGITIRAADGATDLPVSSAQTLPAGWTVGARRSGDTLWLFIHGPHGEGAAFSCDDGSVRGEVVNEFCNALIANAPRERKEDRA